MTCYKVIHEELEMMSVTSSKWSNLIRKAYKAIMQDITLELQLEPFILLRAKTICEDIEDLAEEEFELEDLLGLLYKDFLKQIKRTSDIVSLRELYRRIEVRKNNYLKLSTYDGECVELRNEGLVTYRIKMKREDVLRGEVFLWDVAGEDVEISIGEIIEISLNEFVAEFMRGKGKFIVQKLIRSLTEDN
ncbi:hypothetical protein [Bacillus sp. 18-5]|uniref:hypothetical protein n=1 Tax=Bacillus sp. 18-5 TaxID=3458701 RepID=UPI0040467128